MISFSGVQKSMNSDVVPIAVSALQHSNNYWFLQSSALQIILTSNYLSRWSLIFIILLFCSNQFMNKLKPCGRRATSDRENSDQSFRDFILSILSTAVIGYITWFLSNFPNMMKEFRILLNNRELGICEVDHLGFYNLSLILKF